MRTNVNTRIGDSTAPRRTVPRRRPNPALRRASHEALEGRLLMSFSPTAGYVAGAYPAGVVTADFNGDGRADVATVNRWGYGFGSVTVLLSNPNGTMQEARLTDAGVDPHSIAAGDFNRDGKVDVAVTTATDVRVLLGNGDGTFHAGAVAELPPQFPLGYTGTTPLPQAPLSVAVGDFNNDGKLDLAATGQTSFTTLVPGYYGYYYETFYNAHVNVLLGHGDGTFTPESTRPTSSPYAYDLAVADLNHDGKLDVLTAYGYASAMLGNGDGTLGSPIDSGYGYSPAALGDLDGDGVLDLVLQSGDGIDLAVHHGNGDGTFAAPDVVPVASGLGSVVVGDLNGDGKLDLVATHHSTTYAGYRYYYGYYDPFTTDYASVLLGNGDGSFSLPITSTIGAYAWSASWTHSALADFNGDGRPDIVVSLSAVNAVLVAMNDGNWVAPPRPVEISVADTTVTEGNTGTSNAVFTVTLSEPSPQTVSVQYNTAGGSASPGTDFTAASGLLTFAPGETSKTIPVPVAGDLVDEYDETFSVNLFNATNGVVVDGQATGTILDNDAAPTIVIRDASGSEGRKGTTTSFQFEVVLSAPSEKSVSVNFSTANGTATTADGDYVATSGTLVFNPGETLKRISVVVRGDNRRESNETFLVNLGSVTNAVLGDGQAVGTILDDDAR